MSEAGLHSGVTFIGGTCLRACYGSARLSEDLDFTGGSDFQHSGLAELASVLTERLQTRYDLPVSVGEPMKVGVKVSTWKLTIETRPGQKHRPAQRIHLDICAIPSHDPRPMMLRNLYGIELPTDLIPIKIRDHQHEDAEFVTLLTERTASLRTQPVMREDFIKEMRRFLPTDTVRDTIEK